MIDYKNKNWELYLSRPFDLLGASLWHAWYASVACQEVFGLTFKHGLFIEYPRGITVYFRVREEWEIYKNNYRNLALHEGKKVAEILQKAFELNDQADRILKNKTPLKLSEALEMFFSLGIYATAFPYMIADALAAKSEENKILFEQCEKLRGVSKYPLFLSEVIEPLCEEELEQAGYPRAAAHRLTINEILNHNFERLQKEEIEDKDYFIYEIDDNQEKVSYTEDPQALINSLSGISETTELKGSPAYKGTVQGRVRLILDNNLAQSFERGDVLVAMSTSPVLMPFIEKAAAIVTDEGGVTCHAAVIARELKKPCIIGTKNATRVLKDGDMVEVDANTGIVKKL